MQGVAFQHPISTMPLRTGKVFFHQDFAPPENRFSSLFFLSTIVMFYLRIIDSLYYNPTLIPLPMVEMPIDIRKFCACYGSFMAEKRAASPNRFPNLRPSSYLKRSPSPNRSDSKSRVSTENYRNFKWLLCFSRIVNNWCLEVQAFYHLYVNHGICFQFPSTHQSPGDQFHYLPVLKETRTEIWNNIPAKANASSKP